MTETPTLFPQLTQPEMDRFFSTQFLINGQPHYGQLHNDIAWLRRAGFEAVAANNYNGGLLLGGSEARRLRRLLPLPLPGRVVIEVSAEIPRASEMNPQLFARLMLELRRLRTEGTPEEWTWEWLASCINRAS